MGLGLCSCFWRSSAVTSINNGHAFTIQSRGSDLVNQEYDSGIVRLRRWSPVSPFLCIQYSSLSYGSVLYMSSLGILSLISAVVFTSPKGMYGASFGFSTSHILVQFFNLRWNQSAGLFAKVIVNCLLRGANIRLVLLEFSNHLSELPSEYSHRPLGFTCILHGRIPGAGNKSQASLDALSLGSYGSPILDVGYEACVTRLGVLGVKVGLGN